MESTEGQPFINSNLSVYEETNNLIYMHTAPVGPTRSNVLQNDRVCLSVSAMGRLLPAGEAMEFSVEYDGAAVFGKANMVQDEQEAMHAMQMLPDKYFPHFHPGSDYRPATADELRHTTIYRIAIELGAGSAHCTYVPGCPESAPHTWHAYCITRSAASSAWPGLPSTKQAGYGSVAVVCLCTINGR